MKKRILITAGLILIALLFLSSKNYHTRDYVMEAPIHVEEWMTHPFVDLVDEPLELEEWMTKPFIIN